MMWTAQPDVEPEPGQTTGAWSQFTTDSSRTIYSLQGRNLKHGAPRRGRCQLGFHSNVSTFRSSNIMADRYDCRTQRLRRRTNRRAAAIRSLANRTRPADQDCSVSGRHPVRQDAEELRCFFPRYGLVGDVLESIRSDFDPKVSASFQTVQRARHGRGPTVAKRLDVNANTIRRSQPSGPPRRCGKLENWRGC